MNDSLINRIAKAAAFVLLLVPVQTYTVSAESPAALGQQVYNTYCVHCHGFNMVNSGSNAPDLRKFPLAQKSRFVTSVSNGKGQGKMPSWGDVLSPAQIDDMWAYVMTRGKL